MNQDERLVAIESRLEQVCGCMEKMSGHMDRVSSRLETITRLEERWQYLDRQLGVLTQAFERELARRGKIDENLFDRVRVLESSTGMNSHGRDMAERVALVLIGGLALYTVQMFWGG